MLAMVCSTVLHRSNTVGSPSFMVLNLDHCCSSLFLNS